MIKWGSYRFHSLISRHGKINALSLRKAILVTLSSLLAIFLHPLLPYTTTYLMVACAAFFALFTADSVLSKRVIMVVVGGLVTALQVGILHSVGSNSLVLIVVWAAMVFVSYYLSVINLTTPTIARISLLLSSFTLVVIHHPGAPSFVITEWSILSGIGVTVIAVIIFHPVVYWLELRKNKLDIWVRMCCQMLQLWSLDPFAPVPAKFAQLTNSIDDEVGGHTFHAAIMVRILQVMQRLSALIRSDKKQEIFTKFIPDLKHAYAQLRDAIHCRDIDKLRLVNVSVKSVMDNASAAGYFKDLKISRRVSFSLYLYLLSRLVFVLTTLLSMLSEIECPQNSTGNVRVSVREQWRGLRDKLQFFTNDNCLSNNVQVAIRMVVTLTISYIIVLIIDLPYSAWVIITANIVSVVRRGATVMRSWQRVLGHALGFVLAIPLGFLWYQHAWPGLWFPVLIFFATYFLLRNYFIFAAIMMLLILLIYSTSIVPHMTGVESIYFMFDRLVDTLLGSLIAFVAALVIFPKASNYPIMQTLRNEMKLLADLSTHLAHNVYIDKRDKFVREKELVEAFVQTQEDINDYLRLPIKVRSNTRRQQQMLYNLKNLHFKLYVIANIWRELKTYAQDILSDADVETFFLDVSASLSSLENYVDSHDQFVLPTLSSQTQEMIEAIFSARDAERISYEPLIYLVGWIDTQKIIFQELRSLANTLQA